MKKFVILLGLLFIILGVIGLLHPAFTYHKQEEVAKIGPIKATMDQEKVLQIPVAASIAFLVAGAVLVLVGPRMKS